jgi:GNAT superfamily N-acetyltransferase
MSEVKIIQANHDTIDSFGMCGYKNTKHLGYQRKIDWTKQEMHHGLKYSVLHSDDDGPLGAIEYTDIENAWRPVEGSEYLFIHCIYIYPKKYKGVGLGKKLIEHVIEFARDKNKNGVAVIARKGSWMVGTNIFESLDFQIVDSAQPDFKLMAFKINESAAAPKLKSNWNKRLEKYNKGWFIFTSHQCPYVQKAIDELVEMAKENYQISPRIIHANSSAEAREHPMPFGTFGIVYNGKVVADNPISKTRFANILKKELKL